MIPFKFKKEFKSQKKWCVKIKVVINNWSTVIEKTFQDCYNFSHKMKNFIEIPTQIQDDVSIKRKFKLKNMVLTINDEDKDRIYEELRHEYEDFFCSLVHEHGLIVKQAVRDFFCLPKDLKQLYDLAK